MNQIIVITVIISLQLLAGTISCATANQKMLTIGRTTEDVVHEYKRLDPIVKYLASKLSDVGIETGKTLLAADNDVFTLCDLITDGKVDLVIDSIFIAKDIQRRTGATVAAAVSRKGKKEYSSFIFVRKDKNITTLEELKGQVVVFEDPNSTSAYLLPRMHMESKGLEFVKILSVDAAFPSDKVGYLFGGSEINVSSWVFFNRATAGTLSNLDWRDKADVPDNFKNAFHIIDKTPMVPSLIVLLRKEMNSTLKQRIVDELLSMGTIDSGRKALTESTFKITGFYPLEDDPLKDIKPIHSQDNQ